MQLHLMLKSIFLRKFENIYTLCKTIEWCHIEAKDINC